MVALSCHMALDMLCQEMYVAWWWFVAARGIRATSPFELSQLV